jgi:hypothetical protein
VSTTTCYALAAALKKDTLYDRCECKGLLPRLSHAVTSTLKQAVAKTATASSLSALVAPYAGSMTAVYGWYPGRYNAGDGLRMGNYSLLGYSGWNIARAFLYNGPHFLLFRMHLNRGLGSKP